MIEKTYSSIYYKDDNSNIIFIEFTTDLRMDLAKAREIVAVRLELMKNIKHFLIVDVSNVSEVTPEAKEFLQRSEFGLKDILGAAFVANNPVSALIANIFIKTHKDFEARFFSNKLDAFDWIFEYRKKITCEISGG